MSVFSRAEQRPPLLPPVVSSFSVVLGIIIVVIVIAAAIQEPPGKLGDPTRCTQAEEASVLPKCSPGKSLLSSAYFLDELGP